MSYTDMLMGMSKAQLVMHSQDNKLEIEQLRAELAEANRTAEFNFQQYQDAGRLLNDECEKSERLEKELAEARHMLRQRWEALIPPSQQAGEPTDEMIQAGLTAYDSANAEPLTACLKAMYAAAPQTSEDSERLDFLSSASSITSTVWAAWNGDHENLRDAIDAAMQKGK